MELKELFKKLVTENASDLLLSAGVPPCLKKDNKSIDHSLASLRLHDMITKEAALKFCENPAYFTELVNRGIHI